MTFLTGNASSTIRRALLPILGLFALAATASAASAAPADTASDKAAITERLLHWTAAFNGRDAAGICDLFAPDLIATVPAALDGSRDTVCARIKAAQAKPGLQLHYDNPDIREIIISGDIAIVRLFWTLTVRHGQDQDVRTEAGMDIFKRQPSDKWSIIRFVSFTINPNTNLQ